VDFVRWRSLRNANVEFSNGAVLQDPLHWHNTVSVGLGTEYRWRDSVTSPYETALRAGYFYSMAAVPNQNFTPVVPDMNAHILSAGLGFTCRGPARVIGMPCSSDENGMLPLRAFGIDLAYQAMLFESRLISGNPNLVVNGEWSRRSDVGTVTVRLTF